MFKIGRNEPCLCGSGKKYKKCCLGVDDAPESIMAEVEAPLSDYSQSVHPYNIARMGADSIEMNPLGIANTQITRLSDMWSMSKLEVLSTEDIMLQLAKLGINAEKRLFILYAEGEHSAWNIGKRWVSDSECCITDQDEDFVSVAACELWKRYLPERPSIEMVDDWVNEGYALDDDGKQVEAYECWQRVWVHMLAVFTPEMTTYDSVDSVFKLGPFFLNWIHDYEELLDSLIWDDKPLLKVGIPFLKQAIKQFSEEPNIIVLKCDLGRWLFEDGRVDEGIKAYEDVIKVYPDKAAGYVTFSQMFEQKNKSWFDLNRAIQLLERAKSTCPADEVEEWDIEERLEGLSELKNY